MDKQIDARFDRVEKALGTLVESIAKYNPSLSMAHDAMVAEEELSKGLQEGLSTGLPKINQYCPPKFSVF